MGEKIMQAKHVKADPRSNLKGISCYCYRTMKTKCRRSKISRYAGTMLFCSTVEIACS